MADLEGIELRNVIAEDYAKNAQRLGQPISQETANQIASDDLRLVDQYESEQPAAPSKRPQIAEQELLEQESLASKMAREDGARLEKRKVAVDAPLVETLGSINPQKRLALCDRIWEISRQENGHFHHPILAQILKIIHCDWQFGINDFSRARTQVERDAVFFRKLEDLCDRSNGRIRPAWWTK